MTCILLLADEMALVNDQFELHKDYGFAFDYKKEKLLSIFASTDSTRNLFNGPKPVT